MERLYQHVLREHLMLHRQMVFVMGPRQAGKTTAAQHLLSQWQDATYLNWDNVNDRSLILAGPEQIAQTIQLERQRDQKPLVVFDEIHKFKAWRNFLKGLYDSYPNQMAIVVTGSAKLDVFSRGGDSLMGRYFPLRLHPFTVAEITQQGVNTAQAFWPQPQSISDTQFNALIQFGGYPDPFLKQSESFSRRWKKVRNQQIIREEVRDLSRIQDLDRLELLAEKLKHQVGSLTSYEHFANHLRVTAPTIREWMSMLQGLYYCFAIRPWSKNISRSLLKEPKYYLWDWSLCNDEGQRAENMVALHLLKAVHFWNDIGLGHYGLHFIRDKEKREVDFLVSKDESPWLLIEVKLSDNQGISQALRHFNQTLKPSFAFQVVLNMPDNHQNCFEKPGLWAVPARTFLSQLV